MSLHRMTWMAVLLQKLQFVFSSVISMLFFLLFIVGLLLWLTLLQLSMSRTRKLMKEMSEQMATKKDLEAITKTFKTSIGSQTS